MSSKEQGVEGEVPETELSLKARSTESGSAGAAEAGTSGEDGHEPTEFPEKPTQEEILRIRKLLGRLQKEVATAKATKDGDYKVSLHQDEVQLLAHLFGRGLIRSPSVLHRPYHVGKEISITEFTSLVQEVRVDSFPVSCCFQNLTFSVKAAAKSSPIDTVGSRFMGLFNPFRWVLNGCKSTLAEKVILHNLSGSFKAGTSTLVLGPPGSGVTSLFKVLSERLEKSKHLHITGKRLYAGYDPSQIRVRKVAAYTDQLDNHLALLTVRQTLEFAFQCAGGPNLLRKLIPNEAADELYSNFPDFVMEKYGLTKVADTIVGDVLTRGVSGGERRRVTSTEITMSRRPLNFYDQISTGLDSAATYDIVRIICMVAKKLGTTAVISLLQPPPEVYEQFDEVFILGKGRILYHGKREKVLPYFESLGYKCPPYRDIADFIQEVSSERGQAYRDDPENAHTIEQLAELWKTSPYAQEKQDELNVLLLPSAKIESKLFEFFSQESDQYVNSFWTDLRIVVKRQNTLFYKNVPFLVVRVVQTSIMGIIVGTVFLNIPIGPASEGDVTWITNRYGVVFFISLQNMLSSLASVPAIIQQRPVFLKHYQAYFHRSSTYLIAQTLVNVPLQALEALISVTLVFWLVGMMGPSPPPSSAGVYFLTMFFLFSLNLSMSTAVRFIASISRSVELAQVTAGMLLALYLLFSGFVIPQNQIPPWFIWIYWTNPLSWGLRSVMISIFQNEVFGDQGDFALEFFAFQTEDFWVWSGFGFLVGFAIVCFFLNLITLRLVKFQTSSTTAPEEEEEKEKTQSSSLCCPSRPKKATPKKKEIRVNVSEEKNFIPVNLVFRNIGYSVHTPEKQTLDLLNDVSGYAKSGTMTALMGSSGAGKTTLMDVIAGRKTGGTITGDIFVNGRPKESVSFARIIGYVEQMDIHSPHSTVYEAVSFSAYLRQSSHVTKAEKQKFVERVIEMLELGDLRDREIGTKASGGLTTQQAKRLTIGVELAANPSILFLDEPTSGLDSRAAALVMNGIKNIASTGRTIVCTIHQPSRDIFEQFDRLLLLRRGGRVVYHGPIGERSKQLVDYLQGIPGTLPIKDSRYNPATYMLEAIGAGTQGSTLVDYAQEYEISFVHTRVMKEIEQIIDSDRREREEVVFKELYASSLLTQQRELFKKWWLTYWRSPNYNYTRFVILLILALLWGFTFLQRVPAGSGELIELSVIQAVVGITFNAIVFVGVINVNTTIPHTVVERAAYYRERAARTYSVLPYIVAFTFTEIPYVILITFVFMCVFYFMIGFIPAAPEFFLFWCIYFLYVSVATLLGQMYIILAPNQQVATLISGTLNSLFSLFGGFIIPIFSVQEFWVFMTYISPVRYTLNAMVSIQFFCPCSTATACNEPNLPGCASIALENQTITAWQAAQLVYGFNEKDLPTDIAALIIYLVVVRLITGFGLTYVSHQNR